MRQAGIRERSKDLARQFWPESVAAGVYVAALLLYTSRFGPPLQTGTSFTFVMLGLLIPTLRHPRRWLQGVALDWLPLLVLMITYDYLRGRADDVHTVVHFQPQLAIDRWLGNGTTLGHLLQVRFWRGSPSWYDDFAAIVYLSHFCVTLIVLAVLWVRRDSLFRRYRNLVLCMFATAFITYYAYPAAPPWLAAESGRTEAVMRPIGLTLHKAVLGTSGADGKHAESALANPVAALPSLHAALPLLLALFFWQSAGRATRVVLALYVPAMGAVLVYGGEHYLFDLFLGWLYAVLLFIIFRLAWRRTDRHLLVAGEP